MSLRYELRAKRDAASPSVYLPFRSSKDGFRAASAMEVVGYSWVRLQLASEDGHAVTLHESGMRTW